MVIADDVVAKIMSRVNQSLTVIETVKKIPEYNADLTVMMALRTSRLKTIYSDPRSDDTYLNSSGDEEPKPLGPDNCMREGIETKPLPLLGMDNIDMLSGSTMGNLGYGFKAVGNSSRRTPKGNQGSRSNSRRLDKQKSMIYNNKIAKNAKGSTIQNRNSSFGGEGELEGLDRDTLIDGDLDVEEDNDARSIRSKANTVRNK